MELITIECVLSIRVGSFLIILDSFPIFLILWCYLISPFGERKKLEQCCRYVAFVMTDGREEHAWKL